MARNMFYFQMPQSIHFFPGFKSGLKMMVSDLNHLPGRVKRSDLVQSRRDTSPDVVGGLIRAQEYYLSVTSLWGRPENTHLGLIWAHLGLWRPLEAKPDRQW